MYGQRIWPGSYGREKGVSIVTTYILLKMLLGDVDGNASLPTYCLVPFGSIFQ